MSPLAATIAFYESNQLLDHEPADSQTGEVNSGWVGMQDFVAMAIIISVGTMVAGATLNADVEQATDNAGAGIKNIAGKSITQLTQAGGDGNQAIIIWIRAEELDVANDFDFVQLEVTGAVDATEYAFFIFGINAQYEPVAVTAWQEVVD